jgi:hypothetical protein
LNWTASELKLFAHALPGQISKRSEFRAVECFIVSVETSGTYFGDGVYYYLSLTDWSTIILINTELFWTYSGLIVLAGRESAFHGSLHKTVCHRDKIYVDGDVHTNTLFKRGIMGTWHRISAKHLASYLEEMTFRFNRRTSSTADRQSRHYICATISRAWQRISPQLSCDA